MVQWVKDLVVSLQQLRMLLWHGFDSWPGNFHMPMAWLKKIKKKKLKLVSRGEDVVYLIIWFFS